MVRRSAFEEEKHAAGGAQPTTSGAVTGAAGASYHNEREHRSLAGMAKSMLGPMFWHAKPNGWLEKLNSGTRVFHEEVKFRPIFLHVP